MAEQSLSIDAIRAPAALALAGLAALAVAIGIGRFAFTPILPMMREDAGLSVAEGGWLASANYAGYLLGALWAAVQRARTAVAIRTSLAAIGIATLGMSLDVGMAGWAALRFVAGIASAWVLIHVSAACLGRLAPLRRPLLEGAVFSGVGVGIVAAGVLCAALIAVHASSASAWVHLGLLALAATLVIWNVFEPSFEAVRPILRERRWSLAHARFAFAYGAFGFGYIIPATFIPVLAKDLIGDPVAFGWAWPAFGAAAAVSTLAMTFAAKRLSARALWVAAQLVMALGVSAPVAWPGSTGIALAAVCVGGTFMIITMAGMQEARRRARSDPAGLMATMTAAFAIGQIIGPVLVSVIADFSTTLLVASGVLVAGVCALWIPGD
ncbi:MAG TPA: YbfB/YjiJ family MFS transporter [Burkholderiales bacterium]|jgi:predicted MFS family arabinose efflux permease|nr:YbfB/YjiJ family MFS transporter [Burkholderiales bacterium]